MCPYQRGSRVSANKTHAHTHTGHLEQGQDCARWWLVEKSLNADPHPRRGLGGTVREEWRQLGVTDLLLVCAFLAVMQSGWSLSGCTGGLLLWHNGCHTEPTCPSALYKHLLILESSSVPRNTKFCICIEIQIVSKIEACYLLKTWRRIGMMLCVYPGITDIRLTTTHGWHCISLD